MENDKKQYEIFRQMTPQQKLEAAMSLYHSAKELKLAWLRRIHSDWSEEQLQQAVREAFVNARS